MNMKKQLITFMMIFLGLSWACSEDEDNHLPVIEPEDSGVFTDAEGREFSWVRYGNLEWMTTNLNIEASYGYEISHERTRNPIELEAEKEQNYATFGYLYTYEAALEVVPEGWRIPTDEDWQELEKAMGMSANELNMTGWRGASEGALLQQAEGTKINLRREEGQNMTVTVIFHLICLCLWVSIGPQPRKERKAITIIVGRLVTNRNKSPERL